MKVAEVAYAMKKRALEERDEADANAEKKQKHLTTIAKEVICPITHELPIKPVTAEDGKIYEEKAIREWFLQKDGDPTSPSTGAVIGTRLLPAPQARNTIEALVKSGAIAGEIAEAWTTKLADETKVKETRAKAEGGDGQAMHRLGVWYQYGKNGLTKDKAQARAWYERSAATRHPMGLSCFGKCLTNGSDYGHKNISLGLVYLTDAAHLGSNHAAYKLGDAFAHGKCGLPKDSVQARFWLKKVAGDECKYKHLSAKGIADAAKWLRELDE